MIDFKKLRGWTGLSQVEMAALLGIKQGSYSGIESGKSSPSRHLEELAIERLTPTVLFINHHNSTAMIVKAMLASGQIDRAEHEPDEFQIALKEGSRIIVITDDREPFKLMIESASAESGLPIPIIGIRVSDIGVTVDERIN